MKNFLKEIISFHDIPDLSRYLWRMLFISFGGSLCALAVNLFFFPNNFLSGGLSGVALILDYTVKFPTAYTIAILNIPIFILALFELDFHFVVASFIGMVSYTFFIHIFRPLIGSLYIPDEILAAIFGGALNGAGLGIIFKSRASVGGTDIISIIAKRKWSINLGTTLFTINLVIVGIGAFFFPVYKAMYSLIGMFVASFVIDLFMQGFEKRFTVMIVSEKWYEISKYINDSLFRGATLLEGEGAYRRRNLKVVYTVIPSHRLAKLKDVVSEIDPDAFMSVTASSEIMGNWKQGALHHYKRVYHKE